MQAVYTNLNNLPIPTFSKCLPEQVVHWICETFASNKVVVTRYFNILLVEEKCTLFAGSFLNYRLNTWNHTCRVKLLWSCPVKKMPPLNSTTTCLTVDRLKIITLYGAEILVSYRLLWLNVYGINNELSSSMQSSNKKSSLQEACIEKG